MATRRENVRLSYHSNLAQGMGRDAAAAAAFSRELSGMNRRFGNLNNRLPTLTGNINNLGGALNGLNGQNGLGGLNNTLNQGGSSLNQYTGRLRLLGQALAVIGPAAVPIGAIAVPAVAALASSLGFAAIAGGTAVLAFQGVGDALGALKKAHLEPTTANLEAARIAMENLSPAAQEFVKQLRSMGDVGKELRFAGSEGMFPGLTEGFDTIADRAPEVERILFKVGKAAGDLFARGADSLAGEEWDEFFQMIEAEAGPALDGLGTAVGNTTHALAELWIAFTPTNRDFVDWLVDSSRAMDDWASGLKDTQDFSDFIAYVRDVGPQVGDTFQAIGRALLDIAEAAAPLGGPVLESIEAIAKAISFIADSDMGTPILAGLAALTLFNRAMAVQTRIAGTAWAANMRGANGFVARLATMRSAALLGGAAIGVLAAHQTGLLEATNTTNTAMLGLAGAMIGGPWGAAIGAGVGMTMDLAAANDDLESAVNRARLSMEQGAGADVLTRDLEALNRELEKTEERLSFEKPSAFEIFNPVAGLDKNLHNVQAVFGKVEGMFSDLDEDAKGTKKSLQDALNADLSGNALAEVLGMTEQAFEATIQSMEQFAAQFERLNGILNNRANLREYQASLRALSESMKENGNDFSAFTEKGKANLEALDAVAANAIQRSTDLRKSGHNLQSMRVLQVAIKDIQRFADTSPKAKQAASGILAELKRLAGTKAEPKVKVDGKPAKGEIASLKGLLGGLDGTTARPKIRVDKGNAAGVIASIKAQLASIPREIRTSYYVNQINSVSRNQAALDAQPRAAGGPVFGPGTETSDSILVRMSNNEHVWTAREVRNAGGHGAMLAMRSMYQFANGGSPDLEAHPVGGRGKQMPGRLPGRQPASALSGMTHQINLAGLSLKQLNRRLGQSEKSLEREKNQRDILISRRDELASSVSDKFRTDIFGERPEGFQWMSAKDRAASMGSWKDTLKADIAAGRRFTQLLKTLKNKGLNGEAFAELARTGDVARAELFASMTRAELNGYERLFNQRERVAGNAGNVAGDVRFGAAIDKQTREVQGVRREIQAIRKAIPGASKAIGKEVGGQIKGQLHAAPVRGNQSLTAQAVRGVRNRTP